MRYPRIDEIIEINHRHIARGGGDFIGFDNVRNKDSLELVLDTIQYQLFGVEHFPTIEEKAARLAWCIIREHAFFDGCKRTGMTVCILFVRMNNRKLVVTNDEIIDVAVRVTGGAEETMTLEEFTAWIRDHIE